MPLACNMCLYLVYEAITFLQFPLMSWGDKEEKSL